MANATGSPHVDSPVEKGCSGMLQVVSDRFDGFSTGDSVTCRDQGLGRYPYPRSLVAERRL